MLRDVLGLFILLITVPFAHAADTSDICTLRPDLCDDVQNSSTPKTIARKQGCRIPGGKYSGDQLDLPYCAVGDKAKAVGSSIRKNTEDDLYDDPTPQLKAAAQPTGRGPASVNKKTASLGFTKGISFEEYLAKNAMNPAINAKIAGHQDAFAEHAIATSYTIPVDGNATGVNENATATPGTMVVPTPQGNVTIPVNGANQSGSNGDGFSPPPGS